MTRRFFIFALACLFLFLCPIGVAEAQTVTPPICSEPGAFPINDGTCQNYYICVNDGTGNFVPVKLSCAPTAVFNPTLGECEVGGSCPLIPIPEMCEAEFETFEKYDGTCQNYYLCVFDGVAMKLVEVSCAPSAIFVPALSMCVRGEICLQTPTTTTTTTTPAPITPCVRNGRFKIPDVNCKRYYLCYWDGARYTIMDNLVCPNTLVFNPTSEKCVPPDRYICPGIIR